MSTKVEPAKLENLLELFEDVVNPEDIIYAKVTSQASRTIIKERLRLNMNQQEFADYIHATQSLVSRWESGKYNFSLKKLSEIAAALDMDIHIYMTPRSVKNNINVSKDFTNSDWKSGISVHKVWFLDSSTTQAFNAFSKSKEGILC